MEMFHRDSHAVTNLFPIPGEREPRDMSHSRKMPRDALDETESLGPTPDIMSG